MPNLSGITEKTNQTCAQVSRQRPVRRGVIRAEKLCEGLEADVDAVRADQVVDDPLFDAEGARKE